MRCPAMSAISATSAMAATPHGRADEKLRGSLPGAVEADAGSVPAGVPHRWQKRAPGRSDALQAAQVAPASVAPQLEQNLPDACAPHDGQGEVEESPARAGEGAGDGVGEVIASKLHAERAGRARHAGRRGLAAEWRRAASVVRAALGTHLAARAITGCGGRRAPRSSPPPRRRATSPSCGARRPARRCRRAIRVRRRSGCGELSPTAWHR